MDSRLRGNDDRFRDICGPHLFFGDVLLLSLVLLHKKNDPRRIRGVYMKIRGSIYEVYVLKHHSITEVDFFTQIFADSVCNGLRLRLTIIAI